MRPVAVLALAILTACSSPAGSEGSDAASPPSSPGEALVTRYTWTGPGQEAPQGPYAPKDECGEVERSYEFRIALADAVLARDTEALIAMSDPEIDLGFGGDFGHADMRRQLAESNLFEELEKVLALGCAASEDGTLTMPWYFAQDMGEADPFETFLVTGDRIPVFASPQDTLENATPVALLSWELVEQDQSVDPSATHQPIVLADDRKGYMRNEHLRSVIDYRLIARNEGGKWILAGIYAGD